VSFVNAPAAVQNNKELQCTTATVQIENEMKLWLRQACDRHGGREDPRRGHKRPHITAHQQHKRARAVVSDSGASDADVSD